MSKKRVAIAGATGAVGTEMLKTLEKRNFPVESLKLLASERSVGRKLLFRGQEIAVELLRPEAFDNVDIVLSSTSGTLSKEFSPAAVERGAVVVDNTSAFRMDPKVPLVVPEVNPQDIKWNNGIIANPNCSTIIANVPLYPIYKAFGLKRFVSCTYQAVSGAGAWGIEELREQTKAYLEGGEIVKKKFPHQIAFNVFSHNSAIGPDGFNEEEAKMIRETRKIFHDDSIVISATCVRVPVFRAHTEALHCELGKEATPEEIREVLSGAPGVKIIDNVSENHFPMPVESSGEYEVRVGRIRKDYLFDNGIAMLISGDQLLKGAAFNAVQIAELLLQD